LGVFLSGGLDSSTIAASPRKKTPALQTFSVGFREPTFDESAHAQHVAAFLGTRHRCEYLDLEKALLPEVLSRLDEPQGDNSLLPTFLLSRFTRRHVTVALGGDGGDELSAATTPSAAWPSIRLCAARPASTSSGPSRRHESSPFLTPTQPRL